MAGSTDSWVAIGAAALTAAAAFGGVVLAQRGQRRQALEDRPWEKRANAYVDLMSWADNLRDRLHNDRDSLIAPADRDALRKAAQQPQVRAFGSKAVVYQLRSVQLGLAGLADVISPLSMHEYTELNPEEVPHAMRVAEERSAALVIAELTSLEEVVRAELQPFERHVPDRVRLPWRIRIRLARRRLIKHRSR